MRLPLDAQPGALQRPRDGRAEVRHRPDGGPDHITSERGRLQDRRRRGRRSGDRRAHALDGRPAGRVHGAVRTGRGKPQGACLHRGRRRRRAGDRRGSLPGQGFRVQGRARPRGRERERRSSRACRPGVRRAARSASTTRRSATRRRARSRSSPHLRGSAGRSVGSRSPRSRPRGSSRSASAGSRRRSGRAKASSRCGLWARFSLWRRSRSHGPGRGSTRR